MRLTAERRLAAAPERVWTALHDNDCLQQIIPGCLRLEALDASRRSIDLGVRIGPMQATFHGTVRIEDARPPLACRLFGEGEAGSAGSAAGSAELQLEACDGGTRLVYDAEFIVLGKLAQLGSRLLAAAAETFADAVLDRLATELAASPAPLDSGRSVEAAVTEAAVMDVEVTQHTTAPLPSADEAAASASAERPGLSPAVWVPGLIAGVMALLVLLSRL